MYPQPYCIFQYLTISTSKEKIISIVFYNNLCSGFKSIWHYISTSSCHWALKSSYQNILPQEVIFNILTVQALVRGHKLLSKVHFAYVRTTESHYDCHIDNLVSRANTVFVSV